ncbi:hypothetical protein JVT61DRAFT_785 [Boletus reticuloceps]|uniref:Uncharacterized protein n=1 Tax=Boletus reticuloceps TaxID=495285 RepID=A0A8I2Z3M5_9AGAM|nr:hypothetical protein JVT61DRAFT_785 [Boletus reticuloceps]
MPLVSLSDTLKKLRGLFQTRSASSRALQDHSTTAGILAVSRPILALSSSHCLPCPLGSQEFSTIYRNTSDTAQTCLPSLQAAADVIPGVGSIIKGTIGGILSILQLVDRYIQNKHDLEKLTLRLHLLRHHIDNAPISRTTFEETMRLRLLK